MRQKSGQSTEPAEKVIQEIRRATRKVAMKPQASPPYAVERSQAGGDFHVADLPEDIAIKQTDVNRLSSALAGLTFQDVKPKDQMT